MSLEFNKITPTDTFLKYTEELNKIGSELTKKNNIFTQVSDIKSDLGTVQRYKLTTDSGLALNRSIRYLSDLQQAGTFYVTASTLATLPDKPKSLVTTDVIIEVKPSRRENEVIQQITTLRTDTTDAKVVYRFLTQDSNSDWIYFNTLPNNRYSKRTLDLPNTTEPGTYFINNGSRGLPEEVKNNHEGLVKIFVDSSNNKYYEYYNNNTKTLFTGYKTQNQSTITWNTNKTDPKEVSTFLLGDIGETDDGLQYSDFGLFVYKEDNKNWETAVKEKLATGKTNFTFYCQGGVEGNPAGRFSCRGMVISDVPSGSYGIYYAITNGGQIFSGAISNYEFTTPRTTPSGRVLWKGALNFQTTNKAQNMNDTINNYEYVEIYTKVRTEVASKGKDYVQNVAHKFYRDGDTYFQVTGSILGGEFKGSEVPIQDVYRVSVEFNNDTFKLLESIISNPKAQYVTRVIGYNLVDAF